MQPGNDCPADNLVFGTKQRGRWSKPWRLVSCFEATSIFCGRGVLERALAKKMRFKKDSTYIAATNNRFEAVKWLHTKFQIARHPRICSAAAKNGNGRWAFANGYQMDESTTNEAAERGHRHDLMGSRKELPVERQNVHVRC